MNPELEPSLLAARLAQLAQTQGPRVALACRASGSNTTALRTVDFAQFWRRIERITAHLQANWGIQRGDRVAWLGLNHELQLTALVACARLGAIFMPLNFRLAVPELQHLIDDAQPQVLVHDDAMAPAAQALTGPGLQHTHQNALIDTPSPRGLPLPEVDLDDGLLLVYTSGTTGQPKGALHTQAAVLANARASLWAHGLSRKDVVLSVLPLFHVGGLCIQTLPALLAGAQVILHARFEPTAWLHDVQGERPSLSLLVPTTLNAVLNHPDWPHADLSSLRGLMTGSSTVPEAYFQAFHARGIPMGQIYGCTETGPVALVLRLPDATVRVGSAGWPHPECEVKLIDEQGRPLSQPGQVGEVCVRSANLMKGYWQRGLAGGGPGGHGLQAGWFHTGDLGRRDADGAVTLVGRAKDMIISGGENIYPAEIENLLVGYPGVAEVAVVGWPDPHWGEVPVLAVEWLPQTEATARDPQALLDHLQPRLARFKWPKRVVSVAAFPRSALGKVRKPDLLAQLLAESP